MVRRTLIVLSAAAVVALTTWILLAETDDSARVAAGAGVVLAAAALILQMAGALRGSPGTPAPRELADDLAGRLLQQWQGEAGNRGLHDERILPLAWSYSGQARAGRVLRLRTDNTVPGNSEVAAKALADGYLRLRPGRVVILGDPGAGKTVLALLLSLGLLEERASGDPVPVLLSAATWDPVLQTLDSWIVRTVAASYYNGRPEIPAGLLERGLLIPILDGVDEIPEEARRSAIRAINSAVVPDRPVVVTCRKIEYDDLIDGGSPSLRAAPVLTVQPVAPRDLVAYLSSWEWPEEVKWDGVFRRVLDDPDDPVSAALSTPLMIYFAQVVYRRLRLSPAELLDESRFDSKHAVEDHLTDKAIEAAYAGSPYRLDRATRWLTYLAKHLHRYRERDFVWWKLSGRDGSAWTAPGIGITYGLATLAAVLSWVAVADRGRTLSMDDSLILATPAGVVVAVLATIIWYATGNSLPRRLSVARRGLLRRVGAGFATGAAAVAVPAIPTLTVVALVMTAKHSWSLATTDTFFQTLFSAVAVALVIGLALAVNLWLQAPPSGAAVSDPVGVIRQDRRSSLVGAVATGSVLGLAGFFGLAGGMAAGSVVTKALTGWSGWPGTPDVTLTYDARLRDVAGDLANEPLTLYGLVVLLPAVVVTMLTLLTSAWPRFVLARASLAARRRLPWRLVGFLGDAHRRGVLRVSNGVYQFRHVRLQERLATRELSEPGRQVGEVSRAVRSRRYVVAFACVLLTVAMGAVRQGPEDRAVSTLTGKYEATYRMRFNQDDSLVATFSDADEDVRLWNVATGKLITRLPGNRHGVGNTNYPNDDVAFSPDGRTLALWTNTADDDRFLIRAWDFAENRILADVPVSAPTSGLDGPHTRFTRDGGDLVVVGGSGGFSTSEVLHLVHLYRPGRPRPFQGASVISQASVSPDATRLLSRDDAGTVRLVETAHERVLTSFRQTTFAEFSPKGDTLLVLGDGRAELVRTADGGRIVEFPTSPGSPFGILFDADGEHFCVTDARGGLTVRRTSDGGGTLSLPGVTAKEFGELQFSEKGGLVAAEAGNALRVWSMRARRPVAAIPTSEGLEVFSFSPDGRSILTRTGNATADRADDVTQLWQASTGRLLSRYGPEHTSLEFSENSSIILSPGENGAIWDSRTGRHLASVPNDVAMFAPSVVVSPDGRWLAGMASGRTRLWEVRTGRLILDTNSTKSYPEATAMFTPDSSVLALKGDGDRVHLWNTRTGAPVETLTGHGGDIMEMTFSHDGRTLATSSLDGTVRLWKVPLPAAAR